jgi:hypothetical protein
MFRDLNAASTVRASAALTGSTWGTEALGMADLAGLGDLLAAALDGESDGESDREPDGGPGVHAAVESKTRARTEGSRCFRSMIMSGNPSVVGTSFARLRLDWSRRLPLTLQ